VMVDPMQQTADADLANNGWPRETAAPAAAPAAE